MSMVRMIVGGVDTHADQHVAAAVDANGGVLGVAATSLAIHAVISAADAFCGVRLGKWAAGQDYDPASELLKEAGRDGAKLGRDLRRLLPMKTKAEYDPDDIPLSAASRPLDALRDVSPSPDASCPW